MAARPPEPNYYQEFLAEREEIMRCKWLISEREGHDIGFERALTEWVAKHRETWRKKRELAAES